MLTKYAQVGLLHKEDRKNMRAICVLLAVLLLNLNNLGCAGNSKPSLPGKDPPSDSNPISIERLKENIYVHSYTVVINFLIYVSRHPANQYFTLEIDCEDSYSLTSKQLDRENSPEVFDTQQISRNIYFTRGTCEVVATLYRDNGEKHWVKKTIKVGIPEIPAR